MPNQPFSSAKSKSKNGGEGGEGNGGGGGGGGGAGKDGSRSGGPSKGGRAAASAAGAAGAAGPSECARGRLLPKQKMVEDELEAYEKELLKVRTIFFSQVDDVGVVGIPGRRHVTGAVLGRMVFIAFGSEGSAPCTG